MTRSLTVLVTSTSPGPARATDSCSDVHADTGDVVGSPFDFASVKTGAHLDAERLDGTL